MASGDMLLCYLVDIGRWMGLLRVTGPAYWSTDPPIWGESQFPVRIPVEFVIDLTDRQGMPAQVLVDRVPSHNKAQQRQPGAWAAYVRGAPRSWPAEDAEIAVDVMRVADERHRAEGSRTTSELPTRSAEEPRTCEEERNDSRGSHYSLGDSSRTLLPVR